jgi:hypothetical protein
MAGLAERAGVALNTVKAVENGADCSTMQALEDTLKANGVLFAPGRVGVKMVWPNGRPASREVREAALAVLNADRKAKGQAPFIALEGAK